MINKIKKCVFIAICSLGAINYASEFKEEKGFFEKDSLLTEYILRKFNQSLEADLDDKFGFGKSALNKEKALDKRWYQPVRSHALSCENKNPSSNFYWSPGVKSIFFCLYKGHDKYELDYTISGYGVSNVNDKKNISEDSAKLLIGIASHIEVGGRNHIQDIDREIPQVNKNIFYGEKESGIIEDQYTKCRFESYKKESIIPTKKYVCSTLMFFDDFKKIMESIKKT